jgi:hypothetical protein
VSAVPDDDALELPSSISGRLEVELSEPAVPLAPNLHMFRAPTNATIHRVALLVEIYDDDDADEGRALTDEELVRHRAPDGICFTLRDVLAAVEETERQTRGASDWQGGIDVHHVFFEGIYLEDNDIWTIHWGS